MEVSPGRLLGLRVALAVGGILALIFGVLPLFFPRNFLDSFGFSGEPLTSVLRAAFAQAGTLYISWAVAIAIALRDPLGSRGLIQAIIVPLILLGAIGFYFDLLVLGQAQAAAFDVLTLLLGLVIFALYPWRRQA